MSQSSFVCTQLKWFWLVGISVKYSLAHNMRQGKKKNSRCAVKKK